MTIYGKTLKEYLIASKVFLLAVLIITIVQLVLQLLKILPPVSIYTSIIGWIRLFLISWAGWFLVKKHNFQLKQVFIVGCLFFFLTVFWVLLVLFKVFLINVLTIAALIYFEIVNFIIVIFGILFGGWLGKKFSRK